MALPIYLAMTQAELRGCPEPPPRVGYLACQFSPYSSGLSNVPRTLPAGSVLLLSDSTPMDRHDPEQILRELGEAVERLRVESVLLDFQCPGQERLPDLIHMLAKELPCPVCVSACYGDTGDFPVLVPPVPLTCTPEAYLEPWRGREIWLEVCREPMLYTVTEQGCRKTPGMTEVYPLQDKTLCCRYRIVKGAGQVRFYLHREDGDLAELLERGMSLGVSRAVGLYQQFAPAEPV